MFTHSSIYSLLICSLTFLGLRADDSVGPYLGTIKTTEAHLLYSPGKEVVQLRLTVRDDRDAVIASIETKSDPEQDFVAKFQVTGLTPGSHYRYQIEKIVAGKATLIAGGTEDFQFSTVPEQRRGQVVTAAFVSCVNDSTDPVWKEMAKHELNLLCLGGDTPYADTGNLADLRQKHRHLLQRPNLADMGRSISVVGTWDDHDFGLNNANGKRDAALKSNTRRALMEYRAHDQFGSGNEGIFHKTDQGALEVFLLDARWYSQTSASPVDANQSTCFGKTQWQWLLENLRQSKAPFKILLQGQIWQDKKNGETDDMQTYYAERDALLDFIKTEKISGVVLVGGDIHVSRYLMHPQRVGYNLHDFIISPGHTSVIPSLNVYHQDLEWSRAKPNQFLVMSADTRKEVPVLTVKFMDKDGKENLVRTLSLDQLTPRNDTTGLNKGLRGYWDFSGDAQNKSKLGRRLDARPINGATLKSTETPRDGILELKRSANQYLSVPRSMLDDNARTYTATGWIKPSTLPAHDSKDRHFIMESYVNNHCDLPQALKTGLAISIGLRACEDAEKINLQLHTETLVPQAVGSQRAPSNKIQGGFNCLLDRGLFSDWTQIVVTFDSKTLGLYLNGKHVKSHLLPISAPIAETGGLIIGGHRAGKGRNFDGVIDDVAIWNRVLTQTEIARLFEEGIPSVVASD
ncbi:MAG: alkaline phosphatase D family protein [Mariniblastus sp.]|nr:alkaline phosphatase D family protein [Mariniblastus sp.]